MNAYRNRIISNFLSKIFQISYTNSDADFLKESLAYISVEVIGAGYQNQ